MKKTGFVTVVFFCGCLSVAGDEVFIGKFALKTGDTLELYARGGGATDVDDVWVLKKQKGQTDMDTLCNLLGFDEKYKFSFQQVDDSIIRLMLHDTMRGSSPADSIVEIINLNKKIITYPEHLPHNSTSKHSKVDTL